MNKQELDLLNGIVMACKCSLGMQAGMLPKLKDECFRQIDDLDRALKAVANTTASEEAGEA